MANWFMAAVHSHADTQRQSERGAVGPSGSQAASPSRLMPYCQEECMAPAAWPGPAAHIIRHAFRGGKISSYGPLDARPI